MIPVSILNNSRCSDEEARISYYCRQSPQNGAPGPHNNSANTRSLPHTSKLKETMQLHNHSPSGCSIELSGLPPNPPPTGRYFPSGNYHWRGSPPSAHNHNCYGCCPGANSTIIPSTAGTRSQLNSAIPPINPYHTPSENASPIQRKTIHQVWPSHPS